MATPSSQKAAQVQLQIRQNAMEMQDYLRDLGEWERSIKKRDSALRGGTTAPASAEPRSRPVPVRNASRRTITSGYAKPAPTPRGETGAPRKERGAAKSSATSRHPSAHTYDKGYDKWKNFDVDKALEEAEASTDEELDAGHGAGGGVQEGEEGAGAGGEEAGPSVTPASMLPPPSAKTREVMEAPVAGEEIPLDKAPGRPREEVEKEAGNQHFKAGRFGEAVKCYTRAIGLNPSQSVYHSNRAMAYLRMKEYGPAREDCNTALRLDPTHAKAWTRRASAHNGLGCHAAAAADLQRAVALCPSSKFLQSELRKTLDLAKSTVRKAPKAALRVETAGRAASDKPAPTHVAASGGSPSGESSVRGDATGDGKRARTPRAQLPEQEAAKQEQAQHEAAAEKRTQPQPASTSQQQQHQSPQQDQQPSEQEQREEARAESGPAAVSASAPTRAKRGSAKEGAAGVQRPHTAPRRPALPKSSYEFEREWRSLQGDRSARRKLARLLTGKRVAKLFKTCPEADLLVSVLEGWLDVLRQPKAGAQEARRGADVACAFAALPRFSVTAMLLGEGEKEDVAAAVREVAQRGGAGDEGQAMEARVRKALM